MDSSNFSHDGQNGNGYETAPQESHWQPALRPHGNETHGLKQAIEPVQMIQPSRPPFPQNNSDSDDEEDDETDQPRATGLDPAWGIKRTDSAAILESVHRSPSFPHPHPQSPAKPQTQPFSPPSQTVGRTFSQIQADLEDEQEPLTNADQGPSSELMKEIEREVDHDQTQATRWEEGLPLIPPNDDDDQQEVSTDDSEESHASEIDEPVDTAFHPQVTHTQQAHAPVHGRVQPPALERKETEDVLNGLGLQHVVSDSPPPPEPIHSNPQKQRDISAAFADVEMDEDDELAAAFAQTHLAPADDAWKAALMDDEDEFLIEDADDLLPDSDEETEHKPAPAQSQRNAYAPHQPSTSELTTFGATAQLGASRPSQNPLNAFQPPQQQPNITNRAASFVDQAKGGYKSPYDLPMDLAPKKRSQPQRVAPPTTMPPPPPRSSSITTDKQLQSPFSPHPPSLNKNLVASPPLSYSATATAKPPTTRAPSGFFEELPMAPRVRPASALHRPPPVQTSVGPPRQTSLTASHPVMSPPAIQQPPPQTQPDPYSQFQLQPPEKLDPYANLPLQPTQPTLAPVAVPNARYSPAPQSLHTGIKPTPSPRYSPAPPSQASGPRYSPAPPAQAQAQAPTHNRYVSQPLPGTSFPHQPRTSSPLAQNRQSIDNTSSQAQVARPTLQHASHSSLPYAAASVSSQLRNVDPTKQEIVPPKRSQTQSPSRQMGRPGAPMRIAPPANRPASAFGQLSPTRSQAPPNVLSPPRVVSQPRPATEIDYIKPTDETVHDPLERWKGAPIFRFGFGGNTVTSFPTRTPRYSANSIRPQIRVSAGEVQLKKLDPLASVSDSAARFPGPLKGKAKKKDTLTWLSSAISEFEKTIMSHPSRQLDEKILLWKLVRVLVEQDGTLETAQAVQSLTTILLPELQTPEASSSVSSDGQDIAMGIYRPATFNAKTEIVDPIAVEKLRTTLLKGKREDAVWHAVDSRLWSHALLLSSTLDKAVWKQVVAEFVKQEVKPIGASSDSLCAFYEVLGGNVEESVDQLVPPSARAGLQMVSKVDTSGPTRNALDGLDRWKETLCLILNNRSPDDQRALITLARLLSDYGRIEAAHICYVVARSLVLPNITGGADDPASMIVLLGADHRNFPSTFSNDNDSVLLTEIYEFAVSTLAAGSAGIPMPYLAAFKLRRASELADAGMKTEAQAYCDTVLAGIRSNTKSSLYYNPLLLGEAEVLSNRLKQIPIQSASWLAKPSIEKVSGSLLNKFSSFITGEDSDAESKGSARDAAEAGPFAKVTGSPSLSRNTSQTDLYGSYPNQLQMTPAVAPTTAGSRYAPNGMNSARSSSEFTRARASLELQRSPPSTSHSNEARSLYAPIQPPQQNQYSPSAISPQGSIYQPNSTYQPGPELHMPSVAEESVQHAYSTGYVAAVDPVLTNGIEFQQTPFGNYAPPVPTQMPEQGVDSVSARSYQPTENSFEPSVDDGGYGYQPPDDGGYVPYQPEPDSDDEPKVKSNKKATANKSDSFSAISQGGPVGASSSSTGDDAAEKARKQANDAAAEAAFKAAAEADAQSRDGSSQKKASGSWLGGWFGAGKKPDSLDAAPSKANDSKVHRVHLGESKMKLYYDKDKKKWINPDNPDASVSKATPPPPRSSTGSAPPMGPPMGPPRSISQAFSLPPSGLSRSGTPVSVAVDTGSEGGDSRPGTGSGPPFGMAAMLPPGTQQSLGLGSGSLPTPPGSSGGLASSTSGIPSRPASALSNASGLDDLLGGPPTAGGRRVSGRAAKGKKGRYVDVMAK